MKLKPYILTLSLLCSLLPMIAAAGEPEEKNGLTLDKAVSKVREQTDGRILSAKTVRDNGEQIHQIRVLTKDGRVRNFQMPIVQKRQQPAPKRQH